MGVIGRVLDFYRTRPDRPIMADQAAIRREYEWRRWSVFLSITLGYGFFYVCRQAFSVAKKPMLEDGILNADQMGRIGSALLLTYAFGKLFNGFLADRSNIARFFSTGLLGSGVLVILFGFNRYFWLFVLLWGLNGWFQSMGSAPCGVSLSQWFSNRERGTRYGIWSISHGLGEAVAFLVIAAIIASFGWRYGFWASGGLGVVVAAILFWTMADRPRTYGLPLVSDYKNDHAPDAHLANAPVGRVQWEVIRNPVIWVLGLSSAAMYISRYGINSWGILYLQEDKGYTLVGAGTLLFVAKISETAGTLLSGIISDVFFKARRGATTLGYGLIQIMGLLILFFSPTNYVTTLNEDLAGELRAGPVAPVLRYALAERHVALRADADLTKQTEKDRTIWTIRNGGWPLGKDYRLLTDGGQLRLFRDNRLVHYIGLSLFGFGLGGLLVLLGGLIAIDLCPKRAAGAAMGFIGFFSYIGASVQDFVSGRLIQAGKMTVHGQVVHDFHAAYCWWLGAAIVSILLYCTIWKAKPKE
ncbi:MAG TPA: MFS transporter [Candidatus Hydrogenedentes bacterium]|nr:MFS transporter [Candidatus Hydrogenedentota bacterium]